MGGGFNLVSKSELKCGICLGLSPNGLSCQGFSPRGLSFVFDRELWFLYYYSQIHPDGPFFNFRPSNQEIGESNVVQKRCERVGRVAKKSRTLNFADIKGWNIADTEGWKVADRNFIRVGKWPTLFSEAWKVADTIFLGLESCRYFFNAGKNKIHVQVWWLESRKALT